MRKKPDLPTIDASSLTQAPSSTPPDAVAAAQDALARAAEAAARLKRSRRRENLRARVLQF